MKKAHAGAMVVSALILAATACESETETSDSAPTGGNAGPKAVTLRFEPRIGDQKVVCGQALGPLGSEGGEAQLRDLRYFVHDVRLVSTDGAEVAVELDQDGAWQFQNVALLDFEDQSSACKYGTPPMHTEVTGTVAAGRYRSLRFRIGVPFELNHGDPTVAPPPLDSVSMFWGWGEGYMFLQAGTVTTAPSDENGNAYVVALASMDCEGDPRHGEVVDCGLPNRSEIELGDFDPDADAIVVDISALFEGLALLTEHGCAAAPNTPSCVPLFSRFGLDYATGAATPETQTVFRVAPQ